MKSKTMNWTLILLLSSFGMVMGILSVNGYTQKLEPFLWLLFGIITSLLLAKNVEYKTFLHALIIGLSWGVFNGLLQSIFFDKYLANNPSVQDSFKKVAFMQPRYFVIITATVIGLITGAVLGGLALLFKRIF
ncbi:MAG: hypothetical protein WDN26_16340 [Chitinophagaceae bacterium]